MVSRLTVMMIQTNEVAYIDTRERSELWLLREGEPHALLVSCPLDKKHEMEQFVADVKAEVSQTPLTEPVEEKQ